MLLTLRDMLLNSMNRTQWVKIIHFKSSVFAGVQEGQEGAEGHRVPLLRLGQQLHLPFLANEQ